MLCAVFLQNLRRAHARRLYKKNLDENMDSPEFWHWLGRWGELSYNDDLMEKFEEHIAQLADLYRHALQEYEMVSSTAFRRQTVINTWLFSIAMHQQHTNATYLHRRRPRRRARARTRMRARTMVTSSRWAWTRRWRPGLMTMMM